MAARKTAPKKSARAARKSTTPPSRRWSAKVETDSTHPDHGLFLKSAPEIAKALASKRVSPKGPASGMRMLNFYINRAGKNLDAKHHAELEKAKTLLSGKIEAGKKSPVAAKGTSAKKAATKSATGRKPAAVKKSTAEKEKATGSTAS